MMEYCLISYAAQEEIRKRHPEEPICNHCVYGLNGCNGTAETTFEMKVFSLTQRFVIAEESPEDLPKTGVWCKRCKDNCGKIFHKTLWSGKWAYAIKCPRCGNEWMLYKSKVRQEYTGFTNMLGEFVPPQRYGCKAPTVAHDVRAEIETKARRGTTQIQREEHQIVYSLTEEKKVPTAMELAMRKAMEKKNKYFS